ncbi:response regulator [Niastella sp. OAS944]|uniref:response regulator n=1 Tax=Niastella sp. OAS944 TaxID=2664089 RepID=UPI003491B0FC|nr:CheY-like chemotaxis protein [Chitinophagaceae bacterium OAS944]
MNHPKRVFLIDDDEDDYYFFKTVLDGFEHRIELAYDRDGETAFRRLSEIDTEFPDLLFLDWNMPKWTGKQCLMAIRTLPGYSNIPIIIYTTSRDAKDKDDARRLGASYFLSKPTSISQLYQELDHIFSFDWRLERE